MQEQRRDQSVKSRRTVAFLSILIVLLIGVIAVLGYVYRRQVKSAEAVQRELSAERDSLSVNLRHVLVEYDAMEAQNSELQGKLQEERTRVEQLIKEVNSVRQLSLSKIREYQKELGTLRAIMRHMVVELDSLNTVNQGLIAEKTRISDQYNEAQREKEQLTQEKDKLRETVSKGMVIQARNVVLDALNSRDKDTQRARYAKTLRCCFTLMENSIAKPGVRLVYLRITAPDGSLLSDPEGGTFELNGESTPYSARREIDYQLSDLDLCVYYGEGKGGFVSGKYSAEIYLDGALAGQGEALLK